MHRQAAHRYCCRALALALALEPLGMSRTCCTRHEGEEGRGKEEE